MGLYLNGESRDQKEWEFKRTIYNNSFSGSDIISERMKGSDKIAKISIQNPHLTIIGMTQPKPLFEWIRNVASNDDGLIDRYLIWIVSSTPKSTISKGKIQLPLDWPTQCILMVTRYHLSHQNKQYSIHPELYAKVYELERRNTRLHEKQWKEFLQLLSEGEEEAAIMSRKKSPIIPAARFSEIALRFAVGLHVGMHALNRFLSDKELGDIPNEINEQIIDFSVMCVQRCFNQVHEFRAAAGRYGCKEKLSQKMTMQNDFSAPVQTASCSKPMQKTTRAEGSFLSTDQQEISYGLINALHLDEDLLRKIVNYPAPFFLPKTIYRFDKHASPKEVNEIMNFLTHRAKLGKFVKVKVNKRQKNPHNVFYRAPYEYVNKEILQYCGISSKELYEKLMSYEIGGSRCQLRKTLESGKPTIWAEFEEACRRSIPEFDQ